VIALGLLLAEPAACLEETEFSVSVTCGQTPIKQVTLGIVLPASISPAEVNVGASAFGETGCLGGVSSDDCIGATGLSTGVDLAASRVVPANMAGMPDTYYFSIVGNLLENRLCDPGTASFVFKVVVQTASPVPPADTILFTFEGLEAVDSALNMADPNDSFPTDPFIDVDDLPIAIDDYVWSFRGDGAPARIVTKPSIGDPTGNRWDVILESAGVEVRDLTFGAIAPPGSSLATIRFVGCEPGNSSLPATEFCDEPGSLVTPNASPTASFSVGPALALPLSGVLYVHLVGVIPTSAFDDALNYGDESVYLGTIDALGANGNPVAITFEGAEEVSPSGAAFYEANVGPLGSSSTGSGLNGGLLSDSDGDTVTDDSDNCVYTPNSSQGDNGGVLTSTPDDIGDACQCGDFHLSGQVGRGIVDNSDRQIAQEVLVGLHTDPELVQRCNVSPDCDCNILDVVTLELATDSNPSTPAGPGILLVCFDANPIACPEP